MRASILTSVLGWNRQGVGAKKHHLWMATKRSKRSSPPSPLTLPFHFVLTGLVGFPLSVTSLPCPKSLLREQFLKKPNFVLLFAKGQSAGKLSSGEGRDSSTRRVIFTPLATGTSTINCRACCPVPVQTDPTIF